MTDEQIARLEGAIDAFFNTPNRQDVEVLKAAAAEYLRLLPYIKAVCSAVDAENAAINNYIQTTEHERRMANNRVHAAASALVSAVREGEE